MDEQLTMIFCEMDDFCNGFEANWNKKLLGSCLKQRQRRGEMSLSEVMTVITMFHLSQYRTFKDFYKRQVCIHWQKEFPRLVTYQRFIQLQSNAIIPLCEFAKLKKGRNTGIFYVDSTSIPVCNNRRIRRNKVFKSLAERGKTTMGWFYGFKLHLVINHLGEIMSFCLTKGNVDDRAPVENLSKDLKGRLFGDKGYISKKLVEKLVGRGIDFFTKAKKNMAKHILSEENNFLLYKRGLVETVIDHLKAYCQLSHTRHRSPINFLVNTVAAIVAYAYKPEKPTFSLNLNTGIQNVGL